MDLRQLLFFVRVVDSGSFSRAAQVLNIAQPSISQRIKDLEGELGVELLHRASTGVRPTDVGLMVADRARSILKQVDHLKLEVTSAADTPRGEVTVGLPTTMALHLQALADGRPFLFGSTPSAADLACWQTIFLLRKNCPPDVDALVGLGPLVPWFDRIVAFGHGTPTPMTSEEAFAAARDAKPAPVAHLSPNGDLGGLTAGATVTITPDDNARVPVTGTLVAASDREIVIHRRDREAGDLHIHFPRLGFDVKRA